MIYRLSIEAKRDLKRVYRYGVETFGRERADTYLNELLDLLDLITLQPEMFGQVRTRQGLFRRGLSGREIVFYKTVDKETVEIVRILSHQDQKRIFQ